MAVDDPISQEESLSFGDYLNTLKRRRKLALSVAALVFVIGTSLTILWPNSYTSTATVLIEQPEIPPGLVPTTVTTIAAQQLNYITQRVMTRTNLAEIIEKFDLYAAKREYLPTLLVVDDAENDMEIAVIEARFGTPQSPDFQTSMANIIAFTVGFSHENPKTAQQVANELVSLYLAENVRARTEQTAETSDFVEAEVERLDQAVKEVEAEIATFKTANEGSLPELNAMNLQLMERADSELLNVRRQLDALEESRLLIEAQLATIDPVSPSILPDGRAVVGPADQLKALQTQLGVLKGRYREDHPDVQRVQREIAGLREQLGIDDDVDIGQTTAALRNAEAELAMARERYGAAHPEVKRLKREVASLTDRMKTPRVGIPASAIDPDNPAYLQLSTQLKTIAADERSLREQKARLEQRIGEYEQKILRTAEVERGLSGLKRQLETASRMYLSVREKFFVSEMGESLESQSKGERFVLVEPPDLPLQPSSPNRPVMLALFLVLALAGLFGAPQLAESLDPSLRGAVSIESIFGAPPIAEIPVILTAADRLHARNVKMAAFIAAPAVLIIAAVIVHFALTPLDVLWYATLRRFGML